MEKNKKRFLIVLILYVAIIFIVYMYFKFFNNIIPSPTCFIYSTFHIYCPACGITRALFYFVFGNFIASIIYNPIVIYIFMVATSYLLIEFINIVFHKNIKFRILPTVYIGLAILILDCIIKNILFF